jgi:photosystem II stability/assembly factor-like uncharacterized protein
MLSLRLSHLGLLLSVLLLAAAPSRAQDASDAAPPLTTDHLTGLEPRSIGPATMSGRIVDLAVVESDPYVFYAASATGGVWKTTNNGITFTPVFEDQGTHSVGDIAVHQADTSLVWVGTGERANRQSNSWGDGVYKSTDGGRTWQHMGLDDTHHIGRIVMHPGNPDVVYVAAMGHLWGPNEERGLYMSTDGGQTWTRTLSVDAHTGVVDVAIDPSDSDVMYAATYQRQRRAFGFHGGGPGSGLWKSTDGGRSWAKLGPTQTGVPDEVAAYDGEGEPPTVHGENGLPLGDYGRIGISIYPRDPRIVYVTIEQGYRYNASTAYVKRRAGIYRSMDKGETWDYISDWNPRPMYASQPQVDPNDPHRLYMMNTFSWWDDVAQEPVAPPQSLHGDDRFVWVNPNDSRHVIKADDGGLGISYDRGHTWLYVSSLPLSQYYRVAVDNARPFRIYGGLQDNGSWVGPSATYRREGILNEDWTKVGGGDGFTVLPDTTEADVFYAESQYLGLTRLRRGTLEDRDIRPGDPTGHIRPRRNFDHFFEDEPVGELENAMEPANWDGPYIISPHDPNVLYAGTRHLWKSTDRGTSWTNLGDLTTGVDRRTMTIMGQEINAFIPSIGDGVPYYPTLSAIAESPRQEGVLYAGTADGNLQVSRDGGSTWTEVSGRLSGLPDNAWINGIEPSRHVDGRVYVAVNNYRNDDYANYLYRSDDFGQTWTSITGDLPAERVVRTVREDPRQPDVLWLGTEIGAFVSTDGGAHWTEIGGAFPTAAVNDLVVHPRDNDLVLATHGRGLWILDNVNALQEMTPAVRQSPAHLFTMEPAFMIRYQSVKAHTGDMVFRGENPPDGATVDYWLRDARDSSAVQLTVHDASGNLVRELEPHYAAGLNRVVWNLHYADWTLDDEDAYALDGPLVAPGTYTVRLTVDGQAQEQTVVVREDPRLDVPRAEREAWTEMLFAIGALYVEAGNLQYAVEQQMGGAGEDNHTETADEATREVHAQLDELTGRIARLYGDVSDWTGAPTADQRSRFDYYTEMTETLGERADQVVEASE